MTIGRELVSHAAVLGGLGRAEPLIPPLPLSIYSYVSLSLSTLHLSLSLTLYAASSGPTLTQLEQGKFRSHLILRCWQSTQARMRGGFCGTLALVPVPCAPDTDAAVDAAGDELVEVPAVTPAREAISPSQDSRKIRKIRACSLPTTGRLVGR